MDDVINRIKIWANVKGLSPADLAKNLQMNRSSVLHMMSGRNKPSLQFIVNISRYDKDLDLRSLLTGSSQPIFLEDLTQTPTSIKSSDTAIPDVKETLGASARMIVLKKDGTYESYLKEE